MATVGASADICYRSFLARGVRFIRSTKGEFGWWGRVEGGGGASKSRELKALYSDVTVITKDTTSEIGLNYKRSALFIVVSNKNMLRFLTDVD